MPLTHKHVGSKIVAKFKIYILTRAELLLNLCYEIPCTTLCNGTFHITFNRPYDQNENKPHLPKFYYNLSHQKAKLKLFWPCLCKIQKMVSYLIPSAEWWRRTAYALFETFICDFLKKNEFWISSMHMISHNRLKILDK